jgi:hypothetical protein
LTDWSSIFRPLIISSVDIGATGDWFPNNSIKVLASSKKSVSSSSELASQSVIGSRPTCYLPDSVAALHRPEASVPQENVGRFDIQVA